MDDFFRRFLSSTATVEFVLLDQEGRIVEVSSAFSKHTGVPRQDLAGRALAEFLTESEKARFRSWVFDGDLPGQWTRISFVTVEGLPYTLRALVHRTDGHLGILGEPEMEGDRSATEELIRLNNEMALIMRERTREKRELERTRNELSEALEELRTSYWHLQKIQEVLPLCMRCGRVKTTEAAWQSVVDYLKDNEIFLSHGYCPDCVEIVWEEMGLNEKEETEA